MYEILQVLTDGLTYAGNLWHSLLNYGLIALTLAPFLVPARRPLAHPALRGVGCSLIALAVQVLLWFSVDAVGVSVIWCMLAGYSLLLRTVRVAATDPGQRRLLTIALAGALVGILYYAVIFPPITTVAHGVAVLLGMGIFAGWRPQPASANAVHGAPQRPQSSPPAAP